MPFSAIVTPDQLKMGELVEPGWFQVEISDYKEEPADTDKSTNSIFFAKVLDGNSKGIQFRWQYNEKALGFGKEFYPAVELPFEEGKGYAVSTQIFRDLVGKKLEVYVKRGLNNKTNKEFNEVAAFRKMR